jgi:hypothetical protein
MVYIIIYSITIPLLILGFYINNYLEKKPFKARVPDGKGRDISLGTFNAIGTTFCGEYRAYPMSINGSMEMTYVTYEFFYLLIPILPIGCYRVSLKGFDYSNYKNKKTTYTVLGSEKWNVLEVIVEYIGGITTKVLLLTTLFFLIDILDKCTR